MTLFTEDPWPLIWLAAIVALASLVALRVTQRGKYALVALAMVVVSAVLLVVDALVVTDVERIHDTLSKLVAAVRHSDTEAVLALLTDDVTLDQDSASTSIIRSARPDFEGTFTRAAIRGILASLRFDALSIERPVVTAGRLTRLGKAEFRLFAKGNIEPSGAPFGTLDSEWSLGFREVDGVWKVSRITPLRLPQGTGMALPRPATTPRRQ